MLIRAAMMALVVSISGILAGCDQPAPPAPAAEATAPGTHETATIASVRPALGEFGLDITGMDRSAIPGDNFFEYANGSWFKNTEIPADRSSYNSFSMISEQAQKDTRAILDEAAADASAGGDRKQFGDYYAAFMDQAGIEAKGLAPIKAELDGVAALTDKTALAHALGESLRADVDLLNSTNYYTDRLFGVWVTQNLDQPGAYAPYLVQGGLGMPDRDFYLEGGRMAELRAQYRTHIAKILTLAGITGADSKAAGILALETSIAGVHATQLETNDVQKGANPWAQTDFAKKAPGLDWTAFFDGAGLAAQTRFIVWQPAAVSGIAALIASQPLPTWKDYLAFHALDRASPMLPKAFADEHFAFHGSALSGTPQQPERWKRAVDATDEALGEAVGKVYVERHFSPATKARADAMVQNIISAFGKRIDALEWMTPQTKKRASAKLAGLRVALGYPEHWRDYSALAIRRDDALGNAQRASLFEYRRNIAKLGKAVDHDEWFLLPQQVNAVNIPLENRLIFTAAILQPPFFDGNADDAVNYGAIGAIIGHEISHSFDNSGALFDETGRLANWWTVEDLQRFEAAGAALAAQFDTYRPFPDLAVNGKLTLGEDIADVAGLATAFDAYTLAHRDHPAQTLDGFTPEQRLFLGWAQAWRGKAREQAMRNSILTDVHAPGRYRSETVRNIDTWYTAFDVKEGQQRYLAPDKRIKVW